MGGTNGIKIQIYPSWTVYAVLNDFGAAVALASNQPIKMISVEMVFRSLYHDAQAQQSAEETELRPFLVQFHQSFGLLKAKRQQQRQKQARSIDIWQRALT